MADKMDVQGKEITVITKEEYDYISLTDIAKYRENDAPADIVKNWMRNRSTIDFLGLWEKLNNPDFKLVEFDQFRNESGNNYFVLSPKKWNIRDYADISQLVCLSNLENLNALFINEGLSQPERLIKLNEIAIQQMKLLTEDSRMKKIDKRK